jgi:translation elongation factor EF-Tu-like GTPase
MFKLTVQDVFFIRNRGVVAIGRVESGILRVGDTVQINGTLSATVDGIEVFRKKIDEVKAGDNIGLLLRDIEKSQIPQGAVITAAGEFPSIEESPFIV